MSLSPSVIPGQTVIPHGREVVKFRLARRRRAIEQDERRAASATGDPAVYAKCRRGHHSPVEINGARFCHWCGETVRDA